MQPHHAIKFARWQHYALGHGARFAEPVIICLDNVIYAVLLYVVPDTVGL